MVRHQKRGVAHKPHQVVDGLGLGKRLVATFVSDYPYAGHLRALDEPVERPKQVLRPPRDICVADVCGQVSEGGHKDEVGGQVEGGGGEVPLEAVSGDGLL